MSCGGVGGVGQGTYQYFQASATQQTTESSDTTSDTTATDATAAAQLQLQAQQQAQAPAGGHHHHHGGGNRAGGGDAISQILDTIQQALESADSSDNPNDVIQNAVTQLLSGSGQANSSGTGSSSATTPTSSSSDTGQSFADVLKANGVDFQQFRADLRAAITNAQKGQIDPSTALQSFAPGSTVDVTA